MAAPSTADIESVYRTAESNGLTRAEVDQIAIPLIRTMGTVRSLHDVRSNGELRAIAAAISEAAPKAAPTVGATLRQIDYAIALGADPAELRTMTRQQVSNLISQLKANCGGSVNACAAGRRLGVNGEVWDD